MARVINTGLSSTVNNLGSLDIVNNKLVSLKTNDDIILDVVAGNVNIGNQLALTAGVNSTSTTTGSLQVTGRATISGRLTHGGNLVIADGFNGTPIDGTTSAGTFSTANVTGLATFAETTYVTASKTGATGVVVHNYLESNTWTHTSIAANFTVNLTNVPTTNDRVINITLVLQQGITGRLATGFQINGVAQTILWAGYAPPRPQANATEIQSFTIIRSNNTWSVFSSVNSVGTSYITSNLRAYYDAGLSASAPTGVNGTTWVDLSGSSNSLGNLALAGTDYSYNTSTGTGSVFGDTLRANVNSAGIPVDLTWFSKPKGTFEFWIRPTVYAGGSGLFINRSDSTPNDSHWFWIGIWNVGEGVFFRTMSVQNPFEDIYVTTPRADVSFPLNQWNQLTFTWDYTIKNGANFTRIFRNGVQIGSRLVSNNVIPTRNVSTIGRFFNGHENGAGTTWRGHCAIIRHYSEPLSAAEVLRNFNANRTRFGI